MKICFNPFRFYWFYYLLILSENRIWCNFPLNTDHKRINSTFLSEKYCYVNNIHKAYRNPTLRLKWILHSLRNFAIQNISEWLKTSMDKLLWEVFVKESTKSNGQNSWKKHSMNPKFIYCRILKNYYNWKFLYLARCQFLNKNKIRWHNTNNFSEQILFWILLSFCTTMAPMKAQNSIL